MSEKMNHQEALERLEFRIRSTCTEACGGNIGDCYECENYPCEDINAILVLRDLTEKERPHGEWIDKDYGVGKCWATCSECGESTNGEAQDHGFGYDYSFPNFCPNCGADMREGEAREE